jgi:hypothetical protein
LVATEKGNLMPGELATIRRRWNNLPEAWRWCLVGEDFSVECDNPDVG